MLNKLTYSTYVLIPDLKFITRDGSCQSTETKLKGFPAWASGNFIHLGVEGFGIQIVL